MKNLTVLKEKLLKTTDTDPKWIINKLEEECELVNKQNHQNIATNIKSNTVTTSNNVLVLTYKGEKRQKGKSPLTTCLKK